MHTTVTDALRNFIENEHQRIAEHNKNAQIFKASTKQLKEKNEELKKSEQIKNGIWKVLIATEYALYLQTMKLVFAQLQLENQLTQHAPPDALKEEVLVRFNTAIQDIKNSLGPLSLGLPVRILNTEEIWQKAIASDLK